MTRQQGEDRAALKLNKVPPRVRYVGRVGRISNVVRAESRGGGLWLCVNTEEGGPKARSGWFVLDWGKSRGQQ
jgi:hypothetical protein